MSTNNEVSTPDLCDAYPDVIQAVGTHPMKTEKKGIGEINIPVNFGGIVFNPGEYIYADNNGVIVSTQTLK